MDFKTGDTYGHELENHRRQSPILSHKAEGTNSKWVGWRTGGPDMLTCMVKDWKKNVILGLEEQARQLRIKILGTADLVERSGRARPTRPNEKEQMAWDNIQARLQVAREECAEIERVLVKRVSQIRETEDGEVLHRGPRGCGVIFGGKLCKIDGQKVSEGEDGILRIDDKRSPYNGLPTTRYISDIVEPWKAARAKADRHRHQRAAALGKPVAALRHAGAPWPPMPQII